MSGIKHRIIAGLILLAGLLAIAITSCSDNPSGNDNDPVSPARLYVLDSRSGFLMSLDIPADTIFDSVRLDYNVSGLFLNGNCLLVGNSDQSQTYIYNAADLSAAGTSALYGQFFIDDPDGYGVYLPSDSEAIYLVDPLTLAPTDSILRRAAHGYLDTLNNLFYAAYITEPRDTTSVIYIIDCVAGQLIDSAVVNFGVYALATNSGTGEICFHGRFPDHDAGFYRLDPGTDSLSLIFDLVGPMGYVSITPDNKRIIMTDGAYGSEFYSYAFYVNVFDATTREVVDIIPAFQYPRGPGFANLIFGDIAVTPDSRKAYVGTIYNRVVGYPLAVIDLEGCRVTNFIYPFNDFNPDFIALGPVPAE